MSRIKVSNLSVETIRRDIRNIHLGVYPPNGKIRMAVPLKTKDETIRLFIISKIPWIKKQQRFFAKQPRQTPRKYVTGETHYVFGKAYRLNVIKSNEPSKILIKKKTHIDLHVKKSSTILQRRKLFEKFYRKELEIILSKSIKKWEKKVGVKAKEVRMRKMKTKWGTCNNKEKRIWLNLELAKKPFHCIDYVIVHELVHLKETKHNARFMKLLESAYPRWQEHKDELNRGILGFFEWGCKSNPKLKKIIRN
ncbi:MAG: M48 family metallopeptidase [Nitrosopumilaceae archaeon]|nr:M48 family metallopeptidase [Nitrosopumilaceae archaeon]